ncbi:Hypothetical predicted protein, partial [Lynx pardinus]
RNSSQKKEQEKVTARDLIEIDISNRSDGEFKLIIVRILAGLKKRMEDIRENLTAEIRGVPEDEREKREEGLYEDIKAEKFPNLGKETDIQIQDTQKTPIKINKASQHQDIL